jgi:hypothetical protein
LEEGLNPQGWGGRDIVEMVALREGGIKKEKGA